MRFYIPKCNYCKYEKKSCNAYRNIRKTFLNTNCFNVKSIRVNCKEFEPIAREGDIVEFEICGNTIQRVVKYVSSNYKTYIVLTAKNQKNKDMFTLITYDYRGDEHYKKYYDDSEYYDIPKNLMTGFVNYKFIKRVVRHTDISKIKNPSINEKLISSQFDFLFKKDSK